MKTNGVVFDFDGVLVDSEKFYVSFWENLHQEEKREFKVSPTGYSIDEYIQKVGFSLKKDEIIKKKEHQEQRFFEKTTFNDRLKDFIVYQTEKKKTRFIIGSNNSSILIRDFLKSNKMLHYFVDVITPNLGCLPKPDPHIYLECANRLKLKKESVIVVEDSKLGMKAAKLAGLKSIFLPFPRNDWDLKELQKLCN